MAKATKKKATIKTLKCPIPLPQNGMRLWIENKQYEVIGENKVKSKDGTVYKVV